MSDLVSQMLACRTVAVVGASPNPEKYGHRIFKDLRAKGYEAFPVHPEAEDIDGVPCFKSICDLPEPPEVVCFVVPPPVTERLLDECELAGVKYVWMQPGAESEAAIAKCERLGIPCVHDQCIMIRSRAE